MFSAWTCTSQRRTAMWCRLWNATQSLAKLGRSVRSLEVAPEFNMHTLKYASWFHQVLCCRCTMMLLAGCSQAAEHMRKPRETRPQRLNRLAAGRRPERALAKSSERGNTNLKQRSYRDSNPPRAALANQADLGMQCVVSEPHWTSADIFMTYRFMLSEFQQWWSCMVAISHEMLVLDWAGTCALFCVLTHSWVSEAAILVESVLFGLQWTMGTSTMVDAHVVLDMWSTLLTHLMASSMKLADPVCFASLCIHDLNLDLDQQTPLLWCMSMLVCNDSHSVWGRVFCLTPLTQDQTHCHSVMR